MTRRERADRLIAAMQDALPPDEDSDRLPIWQGLIIVAALALSIDLMLFLLPWGWTAAIFRFAIRYCPC